MPTLNLPNCPAAAVWDLIKARLRADAVLAGSGVELVFFESDADRQALADLRERGAAAVVFLATLARMEWFTERSMRGALVVSYQVVVPGLDDRDLLNLQSALGQALYPADGFAFHQSLIDAGAITGQAAFPQPMTLPAQSAGGSGQLTPTGQITLDVEQTFGP